MLLNQFVPGTQRVRANMSVDQYVYFSHVGWPDPQIRKVLDNISQPQPAKLHYDS